MFGWLGCEYGINLLCETLSSRKLVNKNTEMKVFIAQQQPPPPYEKGLKFEIHNFTPQTVSTKRILGGVNYPLNCTFRIGVLIYLCRR